MRGVSLRIQSSRVLTMVEKKEEEEEREENFYSGHRAVSLFVAAFPFSRLAPRQQTDDDSAATRMMITTENDSGRSAVSLFVFVFVFVAAAAFSFWP